MKATLRGWRTRTSRLPFRHHRREGEREGARLHAWKTTGDTAHLSRLPAGVPRPAFLNSRARDPAAVAMMAATSAPPSGASLASDDAGSSVRREQRRWRRLPLRMREASGDDGIDMARRSGTARSALVTYAPRPVTSRLRARNRKLRARGTSAISAETLSSSIGLVTGSAAPASSEGDAVFFQSAMSPFGRIDGP